MGKITGIQIRAWIKADERFDRLRGKPRPSGHKYLHIFS
jgi:hypothetical protein